MERTVSTIDLHGTVGVFPGDRCPACGQVRCPPEAEARKPTDGPTFLALDKTADLESKTRGDDG